jgi:hypothetical protein
MQYTILLITGGLRRMEDEIHYEDFGYSQTTKEPAPALRGGLCDFAGQGYLSRISFFVETKSMACNL